MNKELPTLYKALSIAEKRAVREQYVREQNGKCWHCGALLSDKPCRGVARLKINAALFPENFFKWPVHLHHSHDTGLTIGAVHNHCNAVLWQYHGE